MLESRQSLRIVLDARATGPHFPGVARATLGLIDGLRQIASPHQITLLTHDTSPPIDGLPIERIITDAAPLGLDQQWRLPNLARQIGADVWHAPYYVRPLWGVPRPVVTVFDVIGHLVPDALPTLRARLLFEAMLRLSLRGAAQVITSSQATRADLLAIYGVPDDRISVIPLAADERFAPQPARRIAEVRERLSLPDRYLLYMGSNKPHKNLVRLVRAYADLDSDVPLVIAGRWDPRYPEARQAARSSGVADRVRFVHSVAEADLPALLAGALAFVFPSRYEGFGLPPLEAMACGTPVIASNVSAIPEVVGDAGVLVAPRTAELRDAMQRVLDDRALRERLRQRGLERAAAFGWAETARRTIAVYEQAAND